MSRSNTHDSAILTNRGRPAGGSARWCLLAAAFTALPTLAQQTDSPQMRGIEVIGSKAAEQTLAGSGTYLNTDDIRRQTYDDVNRVLRKVPGVYIREEDGFGLFPNISIRGVDHGRSAKVTLMEDGIPQAPAPYSAPAAYYSPTVGRMSGLEVLKGSSQVRYGPHVTGGVVNYLSTPIPGESKGYFKQVFGEDQDIRSHVYYGDTVETSHGRFGFLVEGFFRRNDGFKTIDAAPDFQDTGNTGFSNDDVNVKLAWEPDTDRYQRIELKVGRTDLDADETYLGLTEQDFRADPFRRYSSTRFDNIETEQERVVLRHFIELSPSTDLTTALYNNEFERNWFKLNSVNGTNLSRAIAGGGADLATLKGEGPGLLTVRANAREYYSRGVQSTLNHRFDTGDFSHELTAGVRLHSDQIDRFQFEDNFTQAANGAITGRSRTPGGSAGDRIQETTAVAVNVDDRIQKGRLTLTPGIRVEHLDLEFEQDLRRADGGGSPDQGDDTLELLGGGIGAIWDHDANWNFSGGVFRGFSPPGPRAVVRNDLEEETSVSTELSAAYTSDSGGFQGKGTLFRTDFDDLVVIDNIGASAGTPGETISIGEIETQGVELSLQWDPSIARGWTLRTPFSLSATYTDAEIANASTSLDAESIFSGGQDGNDVPYVPDFQVTATAGVAGVNWGLDVSATYVDDAFASASNTTEQIDPNGVPDARFGKIDSFFVVDASVYYQLRGGLRFAVGAHNLFDEEYLASRLPHGPRPGKPRSVFVTADKEF